MKKIEEYVKVLADILHIKLLIFLNIKEYLTEEEIKVCRKVFEKICRNAEECIQKKG